MARHLCRFWRLCAVFNEIENQTARGCAYKILLKISQMCVYLDKLVSCNLRAAVCKYRESGVSCELFDFLIFCPKDPFGELFSKITLKSAVDF
jgi:hypothetical protein